MGKTAIKLENISKMYQLGQVGTGSVSNDLKRWWAARRGKEDPFGKIAEVNDREITGKSNFIWALKDVSFDVPQGEVLGIIGRNGAGKSTLLKILSRTTTPSSGIIKIKGRIASLLEVGTGFHPDLSGLENIFLNGAILGMKKNEIKKKLDEIIAFSGVERYIYTPVKRYSSGMYVRLAFAVGAYLDPDILIVDEVLSVGDQQFQDKCLGKMKDVSGLGRTVIFVSHNMSAIKSLCQRVVLIEKGTVQTIGNPAEVINSYFNKEATAISNGIIPNDYPRLHKNGKAFFTFLSAADRKGDLKKIYGFKEKVSICMKFKVIQELKDVVVGITILNDDYQKISYYEMPENNKTHLDFEKGCYQINFDFDAGFLPGKYYFCPMLTYAEGETIDYIECVPGFEVVSEAVDGNHNYRWTEKHGNSFMQANFAKINRLTNEN